eukprot:3941215-Rhodomonas_salina.2
MDCPQMKVAGSLMHDQIALSLIASLAAALLGRRKPGQRRTGGHHPRRTQHQLGLTMAGLPPRHCSLRPGQHHRR